MGVERFGILTLAWTIVGYVSLFDLGLGRALTKLLAERTARGADRDAPELVFTALALLSVLGIAGAALTAALTPWLAERALRVPPSLVPEARNALYLLALSIPVVIVTAALRGVLEAQQRFGAATAIRIPLGVFNFAGPAVALVFTRRLDVVVGLLVAARFAAAWAHWRLCLSGLPGLRGTPRVARAHVRPLLALGGWMTVSNVVSPLMVYLDRFVIGAVVSMSAVAYYVTPYELVTKLWLVPGALAGVLFPAFTAALASDRARADLLLERGLRYVLLATFPVTLAIVALAPEALALWLGDDFARHASPVAQWLAAGVFVNGMAHLPFAFVQSAGRPDLTAKLHLLELPPYLVLLAWSVPRYGIVAAAVTWTARVAVDTAALFLLGRTFLADRSSLRRVVLLLGAAIAALVPAGLAPDARSRIAVLAAGLAAFAPVAWTALLGDRERAIARDRLRALSGLR
jgi:O-antigen/teichoic acid export membrane protein